MKLPRPLWSGKGVTLYHADAREIVPRFEERGHCCVDFEYSEHVHQASVRGARAVPLADGNGRFSDCTFARKKELGFDHLTPEERAWNAHHLARLTRRWCMVFTDHEGAHYWREDLKASGLDYRRTMPWIKEACTPQMSGDQPAVAFEDIVLCHARGTRRRWNGRGKRGVYYSLVDLVEGQVVYTHRVAKARHGEPRIHTSQKPVSLYVEILEDFTDRGELVYDWRAGSGALGIAGMRLGRRVVLVEKKPENAERAATWLEAEAIGRPYRELAAERGIQ